MARKYWHPYKIKGNRTQSISLIKFVGFCAEHIKASTFRFPNRGKIHRFCQGLSSCSPFGILKLTKKSVTDCTCYTNGKHYSGYMYCTYRFTALFEVILRLLPRKQHGRQTTRSHVCDFTSNTSAHARWYANLNRDFRSPSVNQKRLVLKLSIISVTA